MSAVSIEISRQNNSSLGWKEEALAVLRLEGGLTMKSLLIHSAEHGSHTHMLVLVWERESKEMAPTDHPACKVRANLGRWERCLL